MSFEESIRQIKEIPITEAVGRFLPLTKKGANTFAVCPFHDDHHPSMSVHDGLGIYHCFTCGAKGDLINFVQNYKNLDFKEALAEICELFSLSKDFLTSGQKKNPKWELAGKILAVAAKIYRGLGEKSPENSPFKNFLKQREIPEEWAKKFQLGFAPAHNILLNYLQSLPSEQKGQAVPLAEELGLLGKNKSGRYYDKFRSRIMFPIWDSGGKVLGFTSRAITDDQMPKYLNSKASFVFDKARILYGLNFAKQVCRKKDRILLVEGQMDVIALHKYGFAEAIASSGTAFNQGLADRVLSYSKNVYLGFDSDEAGIKAMQKAMDFFINSEVIPKMVSYEPFKDADEFLQSEGALKFTERIENSRPLTDFLVDREIPEKIPELTHKKIEVLDRIFKILAPLKDHILATEKIAEVSKRLSLESSLEQLNTRYKQFWSQPAKTQAVEPSPPQIEEMNFSEVEPSQMVETEDSSQAQEALAKTLPPSNLECQILTLIVEHPILMHSHYFEELLDFVEHNEVKMCLWSLKSLYAEIDENEYYNIVESFLGSTKISKPIAEQVLKGARRYRPGIGDETTIERLAFDLKKRVRLESLREQKRSIKEKQSKVNSEEELLEVMAELINVQKEIRSLQINKRPNTNT